jgi:hypothetical protein
MGGRLLQSLLAAVGAAVVCAIVVAIVDLYLSGHGRPTFNREIIAWPEAGIHLGSGDVAMMAVALLAGILAWTSSSRR